MARKIISLHKSQHPEKVSGGVVTQIGHMLTALCDDGTVWQMIGNGSWGRVQDIPQDISTPPPTDANG